jgi:hypothetical protein
MIPVEVAPVEQAPVEQTAPAPAVASEKPRVISTNGELRLLGSLPPGLTVNPEGDLLGQGLVLDSRIRFGGAITLDSWKVRAEGDLFSGQLAGDPWDVAGTEDARDREIVDILRQQSFEARQLAVSGQAGPVGFDVGLMTSHWGLGMLANDGAHDPEFGRSDFGDRVVRLRIATRPIPTLAVGVAGDRVIDDETATWSPFSGGQEAWQAIGSALWTPEGGARAGIYGVYRAQTEADGLRQTNVGVLDLYGDVPLKIGTVKLRLAGEAAGIVGTTSRAQSYNARDGLTVGSAAATALVEAVPDALPLRALVRVGWASGDADPDDDRSQEFGFDRDFDVGMVMFDEVQGAIDAATYAQLSDESHSGRAPYGADALVGEGAAKRVTFANPIVGVKIQPWLSVKAGAVFAWSTAPISQPFATYRNGGVPVNHLGVETSGYALGTELDWAVLLGDTDVAVKSLKARPALLLQGGHYLASADMGGGIHTLVTATGRVRW